MNFHACMQTCFHAQQAEGAAGVAAPLTSLRRRLGHGLIGLEPLARVLWPSAAAVGRLLAGENHLHLRCDRHKPRHHRARSRQDEVTRRLMTIPGVGPVTSLAFKATIDDTERSLRRRRWARI